MMKQVKSCEFINQISIIQKCISIRPLYFFSYEWHASEELPSIFLRGFCYFYIINIIPYR